ncbi:MAG TPA: hypothetical protein VF647_00325 [Longimicrobium sp.]
MLTLSMGLLQVDTATRVWVGGPAERLLPRMLAGTGMARGTSSG